MTTKRWVGVLMLSFSFVFLMMLVFPSLGLPVSTALQAMPEPFLTLVGIIVIMFWSYCFVAGLLGVLIGRFTFIEWW